MDHRRNKHSRHTVLNFIAYLTTQSRCTDTLSVMLNNRIAVYTSTKQHLFSTHRSNTSALRHTNHNRGKRCTNAIAASLERQVANSVHSIMEYCPLVFTVPIEIWEKNSTCDRYEVCEN